MAGEGDSEPGKSFKLLGFLDVKNVPCARESVLYGSLGSLVMGLGHFLATSKYLLLLGFLYYLQEKNSFYLLLGVINNGKSYELFSLSFSFFLSGRVRRSYDVAVGGFICTMLGYWFYCRFNLAQQRIRQRMLQEGMKNRILYEGSYLDPEKEQIGSERSDS
uniref:Cytochrome c oxidase assembly protein COX20, mitochondrial n=1 Tax=Ficedula albicollis TaxID=59894 RepID=U3KAH0_FICAL